MSPAPPPPQADQFSLILALLWVYPTCNIFDFQTKLCYGLALAPVEVAIILFLLGREQGINFAI